MSRARGIPLIWLQSLPEDKHEAFSARLRSSDILERLYEILQTRLESLRAEETDLEFFSRGALEKLIFNRGRESEIRDILALLPVRKDQV